MSRKNPSGWTFVQCFGENSKEMQEADIISSLEFDDTGDFLAIGDRGGRVIILEKDDSKKGFEYKVMTEFQSHEPEFDYLKSLEIEEKINSIKWFQRCANSHFLLTTNDKRIKFWKVNKRRFRTVQKQKNINKNISKITFPTVKEKNQHVYVNTPKSVFSAVHSYHINSIDFNTDNEGFISADDLRVNLWNLSHKNSCHNIVDIKPENIEDLTEVITCARFHPVSCNMFLYASSKGIIKLCDLREGGRINGSAGKRTVGGVWTDENYPYFEEMVVISEEDYLIRMGPKIRFLKFFCEEDPQDKNFFSEIISSISDACFSHNGRYIVQRDYMSLKIWDTRREKKPVKIFNIHESIRPRLCDLYENDCIFDKFQCSWSGNDKHVVTGSYGNYFYSVNIESGKQMNTMAVRGSSKKKKRSLFAKKKTELTFKDVDFTKKCLFTKHHPDQDLVAVAAVVQRGFFVYGCNSEYTLGFPHSNVANRVNCLNILYDSVFIKFPTLFTAGSSLPSPPLHLCVTDSGLSTYIITQGGDLYFIGRTLLNFGEKNESPLPKFIYSFGRNFPLHKSDEFELICGSNEIGIIQRYPNGDNKLYGLGINSNGVLSVGDKEVVITPTLIGSNFEFVKIDLWASIFKYQDDNTIYAAGSNIVYHFGHSDYGGSVVHHNMMPIQMNDILAHQNFDIDTVEFITFFRGGVWVKYNDNSFWFWGFKEYSINLASPECFSAESQNYILNPRLIDVYESDIPQGDFIHSIDCFTQACFALVTPEKGNFNRSKVYSWGRCNSTSEKAFQLGRTYDYSWYFPREIDYGEMSEDENIISVVAGVRHVFIISDKNKLYALGRNLAFPLTGLFTWLEYTHELKLIYTSNYPISVQRRSDAQYVITELSPIVTNDWIYVVLGIGIGIPTFLIVFIFVIFFLILCVLIYVCKRVKMKGGMVNKKGKVIKQMVKKSKRDVELEKENLEMFENMFGSTDPKLLKLVKSNVSENLNVIPYENIKLVRYIGSGGSGTNVFLCTMRNEDGNDVPVAFKSFPLSLDMNEENFGEFQKEVSIFFSTKHDNILKMHGIVFQSKHFGIIMEYCENSDCKAYIQRNTDLSFIQRLGLCFQIAKGMNHLHSLDICHRDLKLGNVLIDENGVCKLMDFGLSKVLSKTISLKTLNIGTEQYQAPEIILGNGSYSKLVDVFSFGIMSYQIVTGNLNPFGDGKYEEGNVQLKIATDSKYRPDLSKLNDGYSWLKDLLSACWNHEKNERPHFFQILDIMRKNMPANATDGNVYKQPITLYIKEDGKEDEEAVDFELDDFSLIGLRKKIGEVLKVDEMKEIKVGGVMIEKNFQVYDLKDNMILSLKK